MMVVMSALSSLCTAHVEYVNDGSDVLHCPLVYCSSGVRE
jgi:hypothetical protein